jgi:S-DNA-T family DNA segregation ATPase FtsK/SpoIIIE
MMKRYSTMKANRQRKWAGTHIYVVIDELAQLIDHDKRRTNDLLSSIARLGRASGIHLIVATQYPTRSYISAQILTNFDCRVCLRCDSALSYRTVMGISLPEENRPLQTGDAVLYRAGKFTNFHCPYVNEKDYDFFRENIVVRKYRTGLFGFLH